MTRNERAQAKRWLYAVGVVPLLLLGMTVVSSIGSGASTTFMFTRLAGADRYDTARVVAEQTFKTAPNVVLATGENFPDALAGGYVAGLGGVPILLTAVNSIPSATSTALQDLKTSNILILGGYAAVSQSVEASLQSSGYTTNRIAGVDRYDTAKQAAESGGVASVGSYNGQPAAIVASGDNLHFADALASSPIAFAKHFPTMLTAIDTLSPATQTGLTDLGIKYVFIPGGTAAVSDNVASQIQQMGITVQRIAGADRTETAALLASFEQQSLSFTKSHVNLARGDSFPDSLTGGPHAGLDGPAPILLASNPTTLGTATGSWLTNHAQPLNNGHIFGGTAAVSDAVKTQAENDVQGNSVPTCGPTTTAAPTTTSPLPTTGPTTSTVAPTTTACVPASSTTSSAPTTTSTTMATGPTTTSACNPGPAPFCFPASTTTTAGPTTTTTSPLPTTTTTAPPSAPQFVSASASSSTPTNPAAPSTSQALVSYNEPIVCSSVDPTGSDYYVRVLQTNGTTATAVVTAATCYNPTPPGSSTSSQVTITVSAPFQANQYVTIGLTGTAPDQNTVLDTRGNQQPVTDKVSFYVS